jgi:hypothetical protein
MAKFRPIWSPWSDSQKGHKLCFLCLLIFLLHIVDGGSGVHLRILFGINLLTLLCKLDHFINISNIYSIFMNICSLQNRVSKFTPKKFYEIDPWSTLNNFHCWGATLGSQPRQKSNASIGYKKRFVSRINPSLLLKNNFQNK